MRSGGLKSPGVANMFWLGDQLPTYEACDGMQSALIGAMSGGMSGWTMNHADIGAFTVIDHFPHIPMPGFDFFRDAELNVRWMELCVFLNAVYRAHPGLIPAKSSQIWDIDVLNHTKRLTDLFRDLIPYRESLFKEAETAGIPPVRHGILLHPNDSMWFNSSKSYEHDRHCSVGNQIGLFQFYFGDDVIVAPAMRKGAQKVHVYIPEGTWVHFWTKKTVQGPSYTKWDAPLGMPPFFYRTSLTSSAQWEAFFQRLADKYRPHLTEARAIVI
jgi:alpha-glucosidase